LNQTYQDIEVIVVDDCSTDSTLEVLKELQDSRIQYYRLKRKSGACAARNKGIELAQGCYIAFQDSDDYWHESKLSIQIHDLEASTADVCFCRLRKIYDGINEMKIRPSYQAGIVPRDVLIGSFGISTQTIVAKREVFNTVLFDTSMKRLQDFDWAIRASTQFQFILSDEVLVDAYVGDDSISKRGIESFENALNRVKEKNIAQPGNDSLAVLLYENLAYCASFTGKSCTSLLWKAYKTQPSLKRLIKIAAAYCGLIQAYWKRLNKVL
jgi:glycosyltransferase involved in cell wall biosynthesis